jgi:response regulator of citrate/malate metabolism
MMKNGKTKGNVFVLDEYLLNEEGTKVLKTILQYMDATDTADKDILLFYITNKLGISSYTLKNFTDEASVRKFLFGQSKYKGNNDSIEKAISKFVEENFNIDKILASCKYDADTKSAVI